MMDVGYLEGQVLIAMPGMTDPRFERSVVFLCAHSDQGAMGLIVNRLLDDVSLPELLSQIGVETPEHGAALSGQRVHFGGPVEPVRGFVLHSTDYVQDSSFKILDGIGVTATTDILRAIAGGYGPRRWVFALGYAGWAPGQLESEIQANGWLHARADPDLIFDADVPTCWPRALALLGVDLANLSTDAGHA